MSKGKKTGGITELTKTLITLSKRLSKSEYNRVISTFYAVLNGVSYGYDDPLSPQFLNDARDIRSLHVGQGIKEIKDNVVSFKLVKGGKDDSK